MLLDNKISIVGVPLKDGQSKDGVDQGPAAIRQAGLIDELKKMKLSVFDYGDVEVSVTNDDDSKPHGINRVKSVGATLNKLSDVVNKLSAESDLTVVLGGDHSMALGSMHGHLLTSSDMCVIWIDAHSDINTPETSPSGNLHGMPVAFFLRELQRHVPDIPELKWRKSSLQAKNLVYIGLREVDPGERSFIDNLGIPNFGMDDIDKYGINNVLEMALKAVNPNNDRAIHLSFDIDALDPLETPSTGTPALGGLSYREALCIAERLSKTGQVKVMDIAEVNPKIGSSQDREKTVNIAVELVKSVCGMLRTEH
ncbi:arginase-1-like [Tubulanus polymorphus]|uniref:arginase-1-like n=1 Tax=Tubulanus polymorphus TaxID=672921 RepID=UPI003DA31138